MNRAIYFQWLNGGNQIILSWCSVYDLGTSIKVIFHILTITKPESTTDMKMNEIKQ